MTPSKTTSPLMTVSQLTQAIKLNLEGMFPNVSLQGEITNLKVQSSGHIYFSLKDANAQILAVMFRGQTLGLKTVPKSGDQVIVKAEINVYPPKGNYQLIIRELSYLGIGELLQQLELLKVKLHQMGWFKAIHKKPLPKFPKKIGVVTSPTGAVIQDILHILNRRFSGFHLILNPVKVQGEGAAEEIAQAIAQFNAHQLVDVIIVGRGGGSLEDLWAFNDEKVARAIFESRIPIISAVGHETDHCIADYVADVRAPTPSAAAEIVIGEKSHHLNILENAKKRIQQLLKSLIQQNRYRLQRIAEHPLILHPYQRMELNMQKLDDIKQEIQRYQQQFFSEKRHSLVALEKQLALLKPSMQIEQFKNRLEEKKANLRQALAYQLECRREKLIHMNRAIDSCMKLHFSNKAARFNPKQLYASLDRLVLDHCKRSAEKLAHTKTILESIDPKNLLTKGYSILIAQNTSTVINSIYQLHPGQKGKLLLSDGEVLITIDKVTTING